MAGARLLVVELGGYRPLPHPAAIKSLTASIEVDWLVDEEAAISALSHAKPYQVLVCNAPLKRLFIQSRATNPEIIQVLVTDLPMRDYSRDFEGQETEWVDHVIANRSAHSGAIHELRVTLNKIFTGDIFGLEKILAGDTIIEKHPVTETGVRDVINKRVQEFCLDSKLGSHLAKQAFGICEEMLMNILYDAPEAAGRPGVSERDRLKPFVLSPEEHGSLNFGCDGRILALAARDPFGALSRATFRRYLRKALFRDDSNSPLIDTKKGGAGLGLFKMLYSSHGLICNVEPKVCTEMIAYIEIDEALRDFSTMARSVHYFQPSLKEG